MSKRQVLFLATVYSHLASFHLPFMDLLQERGFAVHSAAVFDGREKEVAERGVLCWEVPFARSPYSFKNIQAWRRLNELFRGHYYDLIHMHTPVAAFLGRYLGRRSKQGKLLYTTHGFHFYQGASWRNWLIYYTAERVAARWTDGLVTMNEEDFQNARRLGFVPDESLFFAHGVGVDLKDYSCSGGANTVNPGVEPSRATLGLGQDEVVVVCVAEFTPNKNHAFLLDAWKRLVSRHQDAHLLLVGHGDKEAALKGKVQQERIAGVHLLGYRRDVPSILNAADLFVLTSRREGLPRCIMEAMAAGKPVVATRVRGNRDLVEDKVTGYLVELGDVEGLARALAQLTEDKQLRRKMGEAGRQKVEAYALERVLAEMARVYDLFLGNSRGEDARF